MDRLLAPARSLDLGRQIVVARRVEPLGAQVDHDVGPGECGGVGAAPRPIPGFQHQDPVTRFDQVSGGHQAGEARTDDHDVEDFRFAHCRIVTR